MNDSLQVRQPREGEAAELAQVTVTAWQHAYTGLLPDRFWDDAALAGRIQMWSDVIASEERRSNARVAEIDGDIIGIAMAADPRDDDVEADAELFMIYLLAAHYGSGAADLLLTDLLGDGSASLWVIKNNPRAQAFYRKHGFAADGAEKDMGAEIGDEQLRGVAEIRMIRPAGPRKPGADA